MALIVGALGLVVWFARAPREPAYQGKPLSSWLKRLEAWDGDTNAAAFVAFREMGTNAIPPLLHVMQAGGPPIQKMIMRLNRDQSVVRFPFGEPWCQTMAAAWALYAMGTNAAPALPVLTNLLLSANASVSGAIALAGIGSKGVEVLLSALTNQNYRIRHSAAAGLGYARSDLDVIVPALVATLQDSQSIVRSEAVTSLGQLHVRPELAVPALTNSFASLDALNRALVLISLSQFGREARQAIPTVVVALKDNDEGVRKHAADALKQIDPETAVKAAVP